MILWICTILALSSFPQQLQASHPYFQGTAQFHSCLYPLTLPPTESAHIQIPLEIPTFLFFLFSALCSLPCCILCFKFLSPRGLIVYYLPKDLFFWRSILIPLYVCNCWLDVWAISGIAASLSYTVFSVSDLDCRLLAIIPMPYRITALSSNGNVNDQWPYSQHTIIIL